jgi:cobalt-precorrin 5A hydrolase
MWWRRGIAVIYASNEQSGKKVADVIKNKGYPVSLLRYSLENVEKLWKCYDALVFVMALGGVVRSICKFAQGKDKDPAVIAVDDEFKFVIPVIGSHWGANDLAREISEALNSTLVITTASEQRGVTSVEELANLLIAKVVNVNVIVKVTSALLRGERVCVKGISSLPPQVKGNYVIGDGCKYSVIITDNNRCDDENVVCLKPLRVAIGVGSKKETSPKTVKEAILYVLELLSLDKSRVKLIASIRESAEVASKELGIPFRKITLEEINSFNDECLTPPSEKLTELGLRGVAEVSALMAGGKDAKLILRKIPYKGEVTVAVAIAGE